MPFCTQCGQPTKPQDAFCGQCGAKQNMAGFAPAPPIGPGAFSGLSARTASILCYVPAIGWIAAVIVLASQKFKANHVVRFHAFQGLYLFICGLFVNWVVRPMVHGLSDQFMRLDHILETLILGVSIFMIVKASREEAYVLPIIGELAQRSATEH